MKVMITGGAGFIGSHVADRFKEAGYEVVIFDNLSSGFEKNIEGYELINGDIRDADLLKKSMVGVDYCIHNAALISVPESIDNPEEYHDVNVTGTFNVLMAAKHNNLKKVLFVSSAAIYGNGPVPVKEDQKKDCVSPYALNKVFGEEYCEFFSEKFGVPTVVFRYFNVFGSRQSIDSAYAAAIPIFISKFIKKEEATIFGDGEQTRDFIYVKDVAEANLRAIENDNANGKAFNIATGSRISLNNLLKLFPEKFNYKNAEERQGDVKHSGADVSLAKEVLGDYVTHDFKDAFKDTLKWYENNL